MKLENISRRTKESQSERERLWWQTERQSEKVTGDASEMNSLIAWHNNELISSVYNCLPACGFNYWSNKTRSCQKRSAQDSSLIRCFSFLCCMKEVCVCVGGWNEVCVFVCFGKFPSLSRECVFCFMSHKRELRVLCCEAFMDICGLTLIVHMMALTENAFYKNPKNGWWRYLTKNITTLFMNL